MQEDVGGAAEGKGMIEWSGNDPVNWVEFPVECFKEVNHGFERIVSVRFGVGNANVEGMKVSEVDGVEEEVGPKSSEGRKRDSS